MDIVGRPCTALSMGADAGWMIEECHPGWGIEKSELRSWFDGRALTPTADDLAALIDVSPGEISKYSWVASPNGDPKAFIKIKESEAMRKALSPFKHTSLDGHIDFIPFFGIFFFQRFVESKGIWYDLGHVVATSGPLKNMEALIRGDKPLDVGMIPLSYVPHDRATLVSMLRGELPINGIKTNNFTAAAVLSLKYMCNWGQFSLVINDHSGYISAIGRKVLYREHETTNLHAEYVNAIFTIEPRAGEIYTNELTDLVDQYEGLGARNNPPIGAQQFGARAFIWETKDQVQRSADPFIILPNISDGPETTSDNRPSRFGQHRPDMIVPSDNVWKVIKYDPDNPHNAASFIKKPNDRTTSIQEVLSSAPVPTPSPKQHISNADRALRNNIEMAARAEAIVDSLPKDDRDTFIEEFDQKDLTARDKAIAREREILRASFETMDAFNLYVESRRLKGYAEKDLSTSISYTWRPISRLGPPRSQTRCGSYGHASYGGAGDIWGAIVGTHVVPS